MATLNIGGRRVTVDDSFLTLSPEQQQATVDEIEASFGAPAQQPAAQAPEPAAPRPTLPGASSALTASSLGSRQGLTFNFGDELMAAATVPIELGIGAWNGQDAGKGIADRIASAYSRGLDQERALQKQAQEQNPVAYGVGNLAGGLATSSQLLKGGATLLKGGGGAGSMIGRGAAEGALYGAAAGAGEGEDLDSRLNRAGSGALVGGAAGGALGAAGSALAGRNARAAVPSIAGWTVGCHQLSVHGRPDGQAGVSVGGADRASANPHTTPHHAHRRRSRQEPEVEVGEVESR